MVKALKLSIFVALLAIMSVFGATADVNIDYVRINGEIVQDDDSGIDDNLRIDLGEELDIRVRLSADNDNHDDLEVLARIIGYEYRNRGNLIDVYGPFDLDDGDSESVDLFLQVPVSADKDEYELRIEVGDRDEDFDETKVTLRVKDPRTALLIRDVIFSPGGSVEAGRVLLVQARLENIGTNDLDDVTVRAEIPQLGVEGTVFLDEEFDGSETDDGDVEISEEIYLRIPACAEPGNYDVIVTAEFDRYDDVTSIETVRVVASESCEAQSSGADANEGRTIVVPPQAQTVTVGQGGASFPVAITNMGGAAKSYTTIVTGVADWAIAEVSDPAVIVQPGETKIVYVFVSANEGTQAGQRIFTIAVNDQSFSAVANIVEAESRSSGFQTVLEIGLIVLVVILILLGLIVGFSRLRRDENDEEGKAYY